MVDYPQFLKCGLHRKRLSLFLPFPRRHRVPPALRRRGGGRRSPPLPPPAPAPALATTRGLRPGGTLPPPLAWEEEGTGGGRDGDFGGGGLPGNGTEQTLDFCFPF
uniref:Uncharacterized protein n=1 Tax=Arundo donax TaxID=35708 RepID=A0A0A9F7V0_ARUDO